MFRGQGNVEVVRKIVDRGVRSLETNQAVIDRETWFKARPRCIPSEWPQAACKTTLALSCSCAWHGVQPNGSVAAVDYAVFPKLA